MLFFVCKTSGKLTRAFTPLLFRYGATASKLSNMTFAPHLVRMLPPDTWSVNSLVKIMHSYGWKRAFVAFDGSDPWAVGYKNGVADSAQQMGITLTSADISGGQASIEHTLEHQAQIRSAEPFSVFLLISLTSAQVASFARAMHRQGLQQQRKTVVFFPEGASALPWMTRHQLATDGLGTNRSQHDYRPVSSGSLDVLDMFDGSIALDFTSISGKRAAEAIAFHNATGTSTFAPEPMVARVYDGVLFAAVAYKACIELKSCKSTNYSDFYAALRSVNMDGITGPLAVETGTNDMKEGVYYAVKNGNRPATLGQGGAKSDNFGFTNVGVVSGRSNMMRVCKPTVTGDGVVNRIGGTCNYETERPNVSDWRIYRGWLRRRVAVD